MYYEIVISPDGTIDDNIGGATLISLNGIFFEQGLNP
jgi:hypothetical protein